MWIILFYIAIDDTLHTLFYILYLYFIFYSCILYFIFVFYILYLYLYFVLCIFPFFMAAGINTKLLFVTYVLLSIDDDSGGGHTPGVHAHSEDVLTPSTDSHTNEGCGPVLTSTSSLWTSIVILNFILFIIIDIFFLLHVFTILQTPVLTQPQHGPVHEQELLHYLFPCLYFFF